MMQFPFRYKAKAWAWAYQAYVWGLAAITTLVIYLEGDIGASGDTTYALHIPHTAWVWCRLNVCGSQVLGAWITQSHAPAVLRTCQALWLTAQNIVRVEFCLLMRPAATAVWARLLLCGYTCCCVCRYRWASIGCCASRCCCTCTAPPPSSRTSCQAQSYVLQSGSRVSSLSLS